MAGFLVGLALRIGVSEQEREALPMIPFSLTG